MEDILPGGENCLCLGFKMVFREDFNKSKGRILCQEGFKADDQLIIESEKLKTLN